MPTSILCAHVKLPLITTPKNRDITTCPNPSCQNHRATQIPSPFCPKCGSPIQKTCVTEPTPLNTYDFFEKNGLDPEKFIDTGGYIIPNTCWGTYPITGYHTTISPENILKTMEDFNTHFKPYKNLLESTFNIKLNPQFGLIVLP